MDCYFKARTRVSVSRGEETRHPRVRILRHSDCGAHCIISESCSRPTLPGPTVRQNVRQRWRSFGRRNSNHEYEDIIDHISSSRTLTLPTSGWGKEPWRFSTGRKWYHSYDLFSAWFWFQWSDWSGDIYLFCFTCTIQYADSICFSQGTSSQTNHGRGHHKNAKNSSSSKFGSSSDPWGFPC